MHTRRYQPGEEPLLWQLFFDTVHRVNVKDYSSEQIAVWAPEAKDMTLWSQRIQAMNTVVCVSGHVITGYAGLLETGYVDHFYVHHEWQGCGVGKKLFNALLADARENNLQQLSSDVSITARPFLSHWAFTSFNNSKSFVV